MPKSRRRVLVAAQFLGVGFNFMAEVGCLTALGWWLDGKWGTTPWVMCLGAAIGMVVALSHLLRSASAYEAAAQAERQKKDRPGDDDDRS